MTFLRTFDTLLHKSDNHFYKINSKNGITLYNYAYNFQLISSKKIIDGNFSFVDYWFDISTNDAIYGIINNKKNALLYTYITNKYIIKSTLIKYDPDSTCIKFICIKNIDETTHIFYFSLSKFQTCTCELIHHYKQNNIWKTCKIDTISYEVLTNFVVIYDNDIPSIFYFKLVDGFEELFISTFNISQCNWSIAMQITSSKKHKIYLSGIKDSNNYYHLLFSENNTNKYCCTYISGYIKNNTFNVINNWTIADTVACTFPNLIEYNHKIYANWIEYHTLYVRSSPNNGNNWSDILIDYDSSSLEFVYCNYHSNFTYDKNLNSYALYRDENSNTLLGLT
ncbi:hypothetical protein DVW12_09815 [Clostridium botulinum]|nr:hypothetical protein [Clostridium botulinum]